jgi:hypothetical protein
MSYLGMKQTVLKTELMEAIRINKIDCWVKKTVSYIDELENKLISEKKCTHENGVYCNNCFEEVYK